MLVFCGRAIDEKVVADGVCAAIGDTREKSRCVRCGRGQCRFDPSDEVWRNGQATAAVIRGCGVATIRVQTEQYSMYSMYCGSFLDGKMPFRRGRERREEGRGCNERYVLQSTAEGN